MILWWAAAAWAAPEMIPADVFDAAKNGARSTPGDVTIPMHDGTTFHLADAKGQWVIVAFWASWCGPCRHELPALATWSKANPDVRVVAVSVDRAQADADKFLSSVHFDLPVGYDPDAKQLGHYGVSSMPTMFLFDKTGKMSWSHTGYSEEHGFDELEAALGHPVTAGPAKPATKKPGGP
jgi:thiol-disulfide isomerase/thioredoxin